jgi:SH3-like domain-containing protein
MSGVLALLAASTALAATAVATRANVEVHSAPFGVAPVIGHLDLDAKVTVDDQASNGWRRVRLSNGPYGFVLDDALRVEGAAPVAAPAVTATSAPRAPDAAPEVVAARVKVFELTARAAPDSSAAVLRVLPTGTLLTVSPAEHEGWRRTRLPDGQTAYVAEAGLDFGPTSEPLSASSGAAGQVVQPISAAPPVAKPHATIYVENLQHLADLVAEDKVVGPMAQDLVTRREAALGVGIVGGGAGLVLDALGLFVFTHEDCPDTGGLAPPLCTKMYNSTMVLTGLAVLTVSTIVAVAMWPKRSDLIEIVNAWNPRHLDNQFTIETTVSPGPRNPPF